MTDPIKKDAIKKGDLNRKKLVKDALDQIMHDENEESKTVRDSLMERQFDEMLSTDDLELKTDLTPVAIIELSRAGVILDRFNLPALAVFTDLYKKLCVSKKRKGREELVQLTTNAVGSQLDDFSLMDKAKSRLM